jgi:hypothetical protein
MFRTDPLTDEGIFDVEFFNSHEYLAEQTSLISYLNTEGFECENDEFVIDYRSRRWHIIPLNKKTK